MKNIASGIVMLITIMRRCKGRAPLTLWVSQGFGKKSP